MKKLGVVFVLVLLITMVFGVGSAFATSGNEVTFQYNDGVTPDDVVIVWPSDTVPEPTDPTRTGYVFNGWHVDIACIIPYDFSISPTTDFTLYADWVDEDTFKAVIKGDLVDNTGNPVSGYTAILQSKPVSATTDASGIFSFGEAFYTGHTLIINDGATLIKAYAVSFAKGTSPSSVVNETASTIAVTYTSLTEAISIPLQLDASGTSTSVRGGAVLFTQGTVTNPMTGDKNIFILYGLAFIALFSLVGILYRKKIFSK